MIGEVVLYYLRRIGHAFGDAFPGSVVSVPHLDDGGDTSTATGAGWTTTTDGILSSSTASSISALVTGSGTSMPKCFNWASTISTAICFLPGPLSWSDEIGRASCRERV